jgi:predicted HD superfamily hydrolase involved in NAD metabolism
MLAGTYDTIVADLKANQTPYRFNHIFGVVQTCLSLGAINGADLEKLTLAALLHDCAKHVGREETLDLVRSGVIELDPEDRNYPAIWHGTVGAFFARTRFGINDPEILQAVEHHTLGCETPCQILQILMCADFGEPTRQQPHVEQLRELIRQDLHKGLLVVLNRKIEDLIEKDQKPHPRIYKTIEFLES